MTTLEIDDYLVRKLETLTYGDKTLNDVIHYLLRFYQFHVDVRKTGSMFFDDFMVKKFFALKPRNCSADRFLGGLLDIYSSNYKMLGLSGTPWSIQYVSNKLKMILDKEYEGSADRFDSLIWHLKGVEQRCECPARSIWNKGRPMWQLAPYMNRRQRERALELRREIYLRDVNPTHLLFKESDPNQLLLDGFEGCKTDGNKAIKLASTMPGTYRQYLMFIFYLPSWERLFGESTTAFDVLHDGEKLSIEAKMGMKKCR